MELVIDSVCLTIGWKMAEKSGYRRQECGSHWWEMWPQP